MKYALFLLPLVLALHSNAQKLNKPKKDKKTGVTTTATVKEKITPNKTKILFGAEYDPVWFSIAKTDTGSIYISFSGQTAANSFDMQRGDSIKINFTDGNTLWLLADEDAPIRPTRYPDGRILSLWYNSYMINPSSISILKEKEVANIGVSAHDKSINISITLDEKKRDAIKKAMMLF